MTFGFFPVEVSPPPPVTTGTTTPPYSITACAIDTDTASHLLTITAMPAYKNTSVEELRVQDYEQNHKTASDTHQFGFTAFAAPAATGSTFGSGPFGAPGNFTTASVFRKALAANSNTSGANALGSRDPDRLQRMEELLGKSLLGEELVNTQFHLFSAKSSSTGRVMKPRVLYANNIFLSKSSKYFLDLLSSDLDPSDACMVDLTEDNDVPATAQIGDYGYDSDSDLDDCDDESTSLTENRPNDGNKSSEVGSNAEQPGTSELSSEKNEQTKPAASSEEMSNTRITTRPRFLGSRHILVKDTAFQTWHTLLSYFYTGKLGFLPLSSATPDGKRRSLENSVDGLECSAKSMYRLASRLGLDHVRHVALAHIRSNLTERNILEEISSRLVSRHPELLEAELDILYSHIASRLVVTNFSSLAQRIAHNELPHGANIITGIHTRLLKDRHPFSFAPAPPTAWPSSSARPTSVTSAFRTKDAPETEGKGKPGPSRAEERGTPSGSKPSGDSESTCGTPTPASTDIPALAASSEKGAKAEVKRGRQRSANSSLGRIRHKDKQVGWLFYH